jgi:hypothetical protein
MGLRVPQGIDIVNIFEDVSRLWICYPHSQKQPSMRVKKSHDPMCCIVPSAKVRISSATASRLKVSNAIAAGSVEKLPREL